MNVDIEFQVSKAINEEVSLQTVVIERSVKERIAESGAIETFDWVMRNFLPNAAGISYQPNSLVAGKMYTVNNYWSGINVEDSTNIGVIVFLQNNDTREIYQVAYSVPDAAPTQNLTNLDDVDFSTNTCTVYPNPTTGRFHATFNHPLHTDAQWELSNLQGATVQTRNILLGEQGFSCDGGALPKGLYLLSITTAEGNRVVKKITIQ